VYCSSSETTIEELLQKNLATLSVIVRAQKPRRCTCCWLCSCRLQTCLHAAWQEARANKNRLYHARKQWRSRVIRLRCDHLRKASIPHSTVEEKIQKVHGRSASHDQPPPPPPPPPPLLSSLPWKELRDIWWLSFSPQQSAADADPQLRYTWLLWRWFGGNSCHSAPSVARPTRIHSFGTPSNALLCSAHIFTASPPT
jgi:hypothetical protein